MITKEGIRQLVEEKIAGTKFFIVDVKVSPVRIAVFIDHPEGVKLEDCVAINKFLREKLGDEVMESHELEVSSPGIDEPLKVLQQYHKLINKQISVLLKDGSRKDGKLVKADEQGVSVDVKQGKETKNYEIPFEEIKQCKEVFSF
jgi:ribosome maturation factor RimP